VDGRKVSQKWRAEMNIGVPENEGIYSWLNDYLQLKALPRVLSYEMSPGHARIFVSVVKNIWVS
jgi:hypothetical protein